MCSLYQARFLVALFLGGWAAGAAASSVEGVGFSVENRDASILTANIVADTTVFDAGQLTLQSGLGPEVALVLDAMDSAGTLSRSLAASRVPSSFTYATPYRVTTIRIDSTGRVVTTTVSTTASGVTTTVSTTASGVTAPPASSSSGFFLIRSSSSSSSDSYSGGLSSSSSVSGSSSRSQLTVVSVASLDRISLNNVSLRANGLTVSGGNSDTQGTTITAGILTLGNGTALARGGSLILGNNSTVTAGTLDLGSDTAKAAPSLPSEPVFLNAGSVSYHAGSTITLTAPVNGLSYQWFKVRTAKNGAKETQALDAAGASLEIVKATAKDAGTYQVEVLQASGSLVNYVFTTELNDPFPRLYGKTGMVVSSFPLTPTGGTDSVVASLVGSVTKTGAFSAAIAVGGSSFRIAGVFDADWKLVAKLPKGFLEDALVFTVVAPDCSGAPKLHVDVRQAGMIIGRGAWASQVGARDFGLPPYYTATVGYLDRGLGYMGVTVWEKNGRVLLLGRLPGGERFSATASIHSNDDEFSIETAPVLAECYLNVPSKAAIRASLTFDTSKMGAWFYPVTPQAPVPVVGFPYQPVLTGDVIRRDADVKDKPLWVGLVTTEQLTELGGAVQIKGQRLRALDVGEASLELSVKVNPTTGFFSGNVPVKNLDGTTRVRSFSGVLFQEVLLRPPGWERQWGIGMTARGDFLRLHE